MVKFGRHLEFYQHNELRDHELYIVPYNEIKGRCMPSFVERERSPTKEERPASTREVEEKKENEAADAYFCREKFKTNWRSCLAMASQDFERSTRHFWSTVFAGIIAASVAEPAIVDPNEIRGALPDTALRLFLQIASDEQVQTLYTNLKDIHSTALINSEALRKLVKKFDKDIDKAFGAKFNEGTDGVRAQEEDLRLSGKLLPEVYSINFNVGLPTVEAGLAALRQRLGLDDEEDEEEDEISDVQAARIRFLSMDVPGGINGEGRSDSPDPLAAGFFGLTLKRRDSDAVLVEKRKLELKWLRTLVEKIRVTDEVEGKGGIYMIECLVAHRGFHSIKDRSDKRPLENSLVAYEAAWTNGIHQCECDIALTKDDRLILAHDENFTRLALDPTDPLVQRKVTDLTYKEIMSLPLKSGVRPPLLFDVLRSAHAIGGEARMIVEIKPGNCEAGTALAKMFARHPQLMERCAVVMSFDAFAMQNLRRELEVIFPTCNTPAKSMGAQLPTPRSAIPINASLDLKIKEDLLPPTVPPPHHCHRRGISVGGTGIIPNIPTAMSIGDMHNIAAAQGGTNTIGISGKSRSDSVDQLGMSLDGMGSRKDSFRFTPFGQLGPVPSLSGSVHLIPPANQQPHLVAPLETIPGGQRVEAATPHPGGTVPPITEPVGLPMATEVTIPKLLLITRNGPAQNEEQKDALKVDVSDLSDLSRVSSWLQGGSPCERLDGLYMQFQSCMIDSSEGMQAMMTLTDHYTVGIWGANPKPDDYDTFSRLVKDCGVSYVNSGLPKKFYKSIRRGSGGAMKEFGVSTEDDNMMENSKTWPRQPQTTSSGHLGLPW